MASSSREVFFLREDGEWYLHLRGVKPDAGRPTSGYVVNGAWYWSSDGVTEYARDHYGNVVNQWPARDQIHWVAVRYKELPTDHPLDELFDDDIPF